MPLKGHKRIGESRKLHSKPFTYYFSLGAPQGAQSVAVDSLKRGLNQLTDPKGESGLSGRFHTRRRTNRLDGQIVSDGQIV